MPAFYVTWGRYTLITGLVLLPLAMTSGIESLNDPQDNKAMLRLAILSAGTFFSHFPGLTEISIKPLGLASDGAFSLTLIIEETAPILLEVLRSQQEVNELKSGEWLSYTFDPINLSKGRSYAFTIEGEQLEELLIYSNENDLYTEGESNNGGDLVFQIGFKGKCLSTMQTLIERVAAHKPGFLNGVWIYIGTISGFFYR